MKTRILLLPLALLLILAFAQCAKRGRPSGGALDSIPPKPLRISPENYKTNFTGNKITVQFDEYIRLDNLQENLIISPPMEETPNITPYSVSRLLEIEIRDSLLPETTYTFNFGNSIVDNNEGNILEQFEYVFSTGAHIDSLELSGKVIDSRLLELKKKVGLNLYRLNERYHDSIVRNGKPSYISVTDEEGNFRFTNLEEGTYLLVAIQKGKEGNPYTYDSERDKFAFHSTPIRIPNDSTYNLNLYRAYPSFKLSRPEVVNENVVRFGYQSDGTIPKIELPNKPAHIETRITKEIEKDSLYFWYHPSIETDSLHFQVSYKDTVENVRIKRNEDAKVKEYKLTKIDSKNPSDNFKLRGDTPLEYVNEAFINLMDQDSVAIPYSTSIDPLHNLVDLSFKQEYDSKYLLNLYPGAITDWQGETNDTLQYTIQTREESHYGSLHVNLQGVKSFPIRVDLLDENSKMAQTVYLEDEKQINFMHLNKGVYYIRVTYDLNKNGKWDPGDFSTRTQPEPVIFFHIPIEVHANWSVNETFRMP